MGEFLFQFIIKDKNGVFTKMEDDWLAEYYDNGKLVFVIDQLTL